MGSSTVSYMLRPPALGLELHGSKHGKAVGHRRIGLLLRLLLLLLKKVPRENGGAAGGWAAAAAAGDGKLTWGRTRPATGFGPPVETGILLQGWSASRAPARSACAECRGLSSCVKLWTVNWRSLVGL